MYPYFITSRLPSSNNFTGITNLGNKNGDVPISQALHVF